MDLKRTSIIIYKIQFKIEKKKLLSYQIQSWNVVIVSAKFDLQFKIWAIVKMAKCTNVVVVVVVDVGQQKEKSHFQQRAI